MEIPGRENPVVKPPGLRDWRKRRHTKILHRADPSCLLLLSAYKLLCILQRPGKKASLPPQLTDQNLSFSGLCHTSAPLHLAFSCLCAQWSSVFGVRSPLYCTCVWVWVYACARGGWRATLGIILQVSFSFYLFIFF